MLPLHASLCNRGAGTIERRKIELYHAGSASHTGHPDSPPATNAGNARPAETWPLLSLVNFTCRATSAAPSHRPTWESGRRAGSGRCCARTAHKQRAPNLPVRCATAAASPKSPRPQPTAPAHALTAPTRSPRAKCGWRGHRFSAPEPARASGFTLGLSHKLASENCGYTQHAPGEQPRPPSAETPSRGA